MSKPEQLDQAGKPRKASKPSKPVKLGEAGKLVKQEVAAPWPGESDGQAQASPSQAESHAASGQRLFGLPPVVDPHTRLLILGSFPGARSLAEQRYYAHPHNQFWRLLQMNLAPDTELPSDYANRLQCLHDWGVGVWDVYASCLRAGSLDSAIREPQLNDFVALARSLPQLAGIAFNGGESWKHHRMVQAQLDLPMWRLPSSSPAHASWTVQRKAEAWRAVFVQAGLLAGA